MWEIKWDGERTIINYQDRQIRIQNRKGNDVTFRYPELQGIIKGFSCKEAILDGEIVVLDENGRSVFNLLAQRSHLEKRFDIELRMKKIAVTFIAFDILWLDGVCYKPLPLHMRKELLYKAFTPIPPLALWSLCLEKDGKGTILFKQAQLQGLEGIVGKHINSTYQEGVRGWVKCKCEKTRDMWFSKYTVNPAGIRVEDENGISVQVAGSQGKVARREIDEKGRVLIEVRYMEVTESGKLRQPTCKEVRV